MKRSIWILLSVATFSAISFADTTFVAGGDVSGHWTLEHHPYVITTGSITVQSDDTLVIDAGVEVLFSLSVSFLIDGILEANGTEQDSIRISSFRPTDQWGGLYFHLNPGICHLNYCLIDHSIGPQGQAGVIYCNGAEARFMGCKIKKLSSANYVSAIRISGESIVTMINCDLSENGGINPGQGGCGGAISSYGNNIVTLIGCNISLSNALDGAGICFTNGFLNMENCTVKGNRGGIWGGGMFLENTHTTISNCVFEDNSTLEGGAIDCRGGSLTVDKTLFNGNRGFNQNNGGGTGGALNISNSQTTITRSTFVNNFAQSGGSAISHSNIITLNSCIFAYNNNRPAIGSSTTPNHCAFYGNPAGNMFGFPQGFARLDTTNVNGDSCDQFFNIFTNPQFLDSLHNYHLLANSPCIDAGDPNLLFDPDSTISDMGAYPYFQETSASERPSYNPTQFALYPAYPNPFNASTTLNYELPLAARVSLKIYNLLGQEVTSLLNENQTAGRHQFIWTAASVPSGMYVASLQSGSTKSLQKLLLLK